MSVLDDLLGFNSLNRYPLFPDQGWVRVAEMAMQNAHIYTPPRFRSINPKTPISDKAAKLFQISGLLRAS